MYCCNIFVSLLACPQAVDWEREWFNDAYFPRGPVTNNFNLTNHGVNNGQAIKSGAVYYRFSGDQLGVTSSHKRMQLYDQYHGVPSGVFQADEHLVRSMRKRRAHVK